MPGISAGPGDGFMERARHRLVWKSSVRVQRSMARTDRTASTSRMLKDRARNVPVSTGLAASFERVARCRRLAGFSRSAKLQPPTREPPAARLMELAAKLG